MKGAYRQLIFWQKGWKLIFAFIGRLCY